MPCGELLSGMITLVRLCSDGGRGSYRVPVPWPEQPSGGQMGREGRRAGPAESNIQEMESVSPLQLDDGKTSLAWRDSP